MTSIEDRLTKLESLVDDQQAQIESHKETIAAQQATIDAQRERLDAVANDAGGVSMPISRRGALQAGGALGLLGLGAGTASAQGSGQIGTSDTPVDTVHTNNLRTQDDAIHIESSAEEVGLNSEEVLLNFNLGVYQGETTPLQLEREYPKSILQANVDQFIANVTEHINLGLPDNSITGNGSVISGGGPNTINGSFSTICGGGNNNLSTEGGYSAISGGANNEITQAGESGYGTIGGGEGNAVDGGHATVPGGKNNAAEGDYSFAVGRDATAEHNGAFVVGNSNEDDDFKSQKEDEARFQMNVVANAFELVDQQGEPTLDEGEGILYISDGTDADDHNKGDLVYGYREEDENTKIVVIEDKPNNGGG